MKTKFIPVAGTPDGVQEMLDKRDSPLVIVSRHGLGDNLFFSPCFPALQRLFSPLCFCSSVNAYASIFHESPFVQVLYYGGVNGADLGLSSAEGFCRHFEQQQLDLGVAQALVYHFGLFEPNLPYTDERAFVKGRRNYVELFLTAPPATETPRYLAAPDNAAWPYISAVIERWLPERKLVVIARYGHTDPEKNFGHDYRDTCQLVDVIENASPSQYKFLSLDYLPGDHTSDGRRPTLRSIYGFLPCDTGSMHLVLSCAKLLVTIPSGPMLVGATIPGLKVLTLWKTMPPFHYLDPQFDNVNPVHALVERPELMDDSFMKDWERPSRMAVERRWKMKAETITPESVANYALTLLEEK